MSLRDDRLAHANPLWLIRISQGVTLMCFVALASCISEAIYLPPFDLSPESPLGHFFTRVLTLLPVLNWLAIWQLATPEYVAAGRFRRKRFCWILREVATIALLCHWAILPLIELNFPARFFAALFRPAAICMTWLYLRSLAQRIPDRLLFVHSLFVMLCLMLSSLIDHALPRFQLASGVFLPTPSIKVMQVIYVVATAYSVFILARYSTTFTTAANAAMENYLSEKAPSAMN